MYLNIYKPFSLLLFFLAAFVYSSSLYAQVSCSISISINQTSLCDGEEATVTSKPGTGFTPTSYSLYLDDELDRTNTTGTFPVSLPGEYYVIATDGAGCTVKSNTRLLAPSRQPRVPDFLTSPDLSSVNACSGDTIVFSLKAPEEDVDYIWNFGDGSPTVRTTFDETVTYAYVVNGTGVSDFTISVEAIDQTGRACTSNYTREISITETPLISFTEKNEFQVCLPKDVAPEDTTISAEITNTTESEYLNDIRTYYVDWGDGKGEVVYNNNPFPLTSAPFDTLGNYNIKIRAVNKNGCETLFEETFRYSQEPKANINMGTRPDKNPQDCVPIIVSLGDSSSGGDLTYKWTIQEPNNGGYEVVYGELDQDSIEIRFEIPGIFNVELIVSNSCGADTAQQSIIVGYPRVQLPGDITACGDTTIKYDASSVFYDPNFAAAGSMRYEWFVDGPGGRRTSAEQYPEFDFNQPGEYTVSARVKNNCGTSDDIGQTPPPQRITIFPLPGTPIVQNYESCIGDRITIVPTGAGSQYEFYDVQTGGTPLATGPTFVTPSLSNDVTYYVAAVSTQGCPGQRVPVTITVEPAIDNNTISTTTAAVCAGDVPNQITGTTPTGGVGGSYIYTWQRSTTGPDAGFVTAPGTNNSINYTPAAISQTTWFRRIVNSGNCSADTSASIQITAVPRIENNTIGEAQQICQGQIPNDIVGSRPTGGAGNFRFSWEVSTSSATDGFSAVTGTGENYTFTDALTQDTWIRRIVESNNCRNVSEPVLISVFPVLANNRIESDQQVCAGSAALPLTGSQPAGGDGNYTYRWESSTAGPNTGFAAAAGTNNSRGYTPGTITRTTWYRRIVTSVACEPIISNVVAVTVNPNVTNNVIEGDQTICEGETPETLTGNTDASYTYRWEFSISGPGAGFSPAGGTNGNADYTPPAITQNTWFRRVVITGAGCQHISDAVAITVNKRPPSPTLIAKDVKACEGGPATISVTPNGDYTYNWYDSPTGGTLLFTGPNFNIQSVSQSMTYYVEAVNSNACASATRTQATVTIVEPVADAGEDITIIQGQPTALRATGGATYLWEPAESLSNPTSATPVARPDVTTTYTVTVTTAEGCEATDQVTVTVIPAIKAPNAFTPNRDGVNEVWEIENIGEYPDVRVEIFNRWGNLVFSSNGYGEPWDGTMNGSDLPVATYYYMIYLNQDIKPISGHVTIIR